MSTRQNMLKAIVFMGAILLSVSTAACREEKNGNQGESGEGQKSKTLAGKYYNKEDSEEYIDLKDDGMVFWRERAARSSTEELARMLGEPSGDPRYTERAGKWKVYGNEIMLIGPLGDVERAQIKGDTILTDGKVWVRRGGIAKPSAEISGNAIPGKYIFRDTTIVGGEPEQFDRPGFLVFNKNGTIEITLSGEWEIERDEVDFYERGKKIGSQRKEGEVSLAGIRLVKRETAQVLAQRQEEIILWSNYISPERFRDRGLLELSDKGRYKLWLKPRRANFGGKWELKGNEIEFYQGGYGRRPNEYTHVATGQISSDSIDHKGSFIYDVPSFTKRPGAKPIAETELGKSIVWSEYIPPKHFGEWETLEFEEDRTYQLVVFNPDGTAKETRFRGLWETNGYRISFKQTRSGAHCGSGTISSDRITARMPNARARCFEKQAKANVVNREVKEVTVWSEYLSPENKAFNLKLQGDGSFLMTGLHGWTWKIEDGLLEVYRGDTKIYGNGILEGDDIICRQLSGGRPDEFITRFVKQVATEAPGPAPSIASYESALATFPRIPITFSLSHYHGYHDQYPASLNELVYLGYLSPEELKSPRRPKGFDGPNYVYIPGQNPSMDSNNIIVYENPAFAGDNDKIAVLVNGGIVKSMTLAEFSVELKATYDRLGKEVPERNTPVPKVGVAITTDESRKETVNNSSQALDSSQLSQMINKRRGLFADSAAFPKPHVSLGLRASASSLVERVETIHLAALDYQYLSLKSLRYARTCLDEGNLAMAKYYIEKADRYYRVAVALQRDSQGVLDGTYSAVETVTKGLKDACQTATTLGLKVINPVAGKVVDYIYVGIDYGLDRAIIGDDEAAKNAVKRLLVKALFEEVKFSELGNRTIASYVGDSIGKDVLPLLDKIFISEEAKVAILKIIKESGVKVSEEVLWRSISGN